MTTNSVKGMERKKRKKEDETHNSQPKPKKTSQRRIFPKMFEDDQGQTPEGIPYLTVINDQVEELIRDERILSILSEPNEYPVLKNPKLLLESPSFVLPITTEQKCFLFYVKGNKFKQVDSHPHRDNEKWITGTDETDPDIVSKSTVHALSPKGHRKIEEDSSYFEYTLVIFRAVHVKERRLKKMVCYKKRGSKVLGNILIIYNYEKSGTAVKCHVPKETPSIPIRSKPRLFWQKVQALSQKNSSNDALIESNNSLICRLGEKMDAQHVYFTLGNMGFLGLETYLNWITDYDNLRTFGFLNKTFPPTPQMDAPESYAFFVETTEIDIRAVMTAGSFLEKTLNTRMLGVETDSEKKMVLMPLKKHSDCSHYIVSHLATYQMDSRLRKQVVFLVKTKSSKIVSAVLVVYHFRNKEADRRIITSKNASAIQHEDPTPAEFDAFRHEDVPTRKCASSNSSSKLSTSLIFKPANHRFPAQKTCQKISSAVLSTSHCSPIIVPASLNMSTAKRTQSSSLDLKSSSVRVLTENLHSPTLSPASFSSALPTKFDPPVNDHVPTSSIAAPAPPPKLIRKKLRPLLLKPLSEGFPKQTIPPLSSHAAPLTSTKVSVTDFVVPPNSPASNMSNNISRNPAQSTPFKANQTPPPPPPTPVLYNENFYVPSKLPNAPSVVPHSSPFPCHNQFAATFSPYHSVVPFHSGIMRPQSPIFPSHTPIVSFAQSMLVPFGLDSEYTV